MKRNPAHWSDDFGQNPGRPGPAMQTPPVEYVPPLPESVRAKARRTVAAWSDGPDDCRALLDALDLWPA